MGGYTIERRIGAGGTGTVDLARRTGAGGFSRRVAIKRLHPHLVDDERLRRALLREARLASSLHHANVVSVVDVDESDGLCLVMEWVDGASLSELLAASRDPGAAPLPPEVAVRIILDACAGLAAVHDVTDDRGRPSGLLHCDVSPQNLLVGKDGVTRVADFGLAKLTETSIATSSSGLVAGKLGYVAPEVLDGRPLSVQSDVFALGVVAWEALARRRVLDVMEPGTHGRPLAPPPPLSGLAPWATSAFDACLAAAADREPARRFRTARAFAEALEEEARRAALLATPTEVARWVRAVEPSRRAQGRLRVAAGGAPAVDYAFAETSALDEETPAAPGEQETTDPITDETTAQPASEETAALDRRTTLRRIDPVPNASVAPVVDPVGAVPARASRAPTRIALLAAAALAVGLGVLLVARGRADAPREPSAAAPPPDPRLVAASHAPIAPPVPSPVAPPATEVVDLDQPPDDRGDTPRGAPSEDAPRRRGVRPASPPTSDPPPPLPPATGGAAVPPPPANPYRRRPDGP